MQGPDKLGRIANNGELTTFDVPTRNSGLGDLAIDQSGARVVPGVACHKVGRFAEGRFAEFEVPTPVRWPCVVGRGIRRIAVVHRTPCGKLGRIKNGQVSEFSVPRAGSRPFGVAVDTSNVVWYTDLRGWLGRLTVPR